MYQPPPPSGTTAWTVPATLAKRHDGAPLVQLSGTPPPVFEPMVEKAPPTYTVFPTRAIASIEEPGSMLQKFFSTTLAAEEVAHNALVSRVRQMQRAARERHCANAAMGASMGVRISGVPWRSWWGQTGRHRTRQATGILRPPLARLNANPSMNVPGAGALARAPVLRSTDDSTAPLNPRSRSPARAAARAPPGRAPH